MKRFRWPPALGVTLFLLLPVLSEGVEVGELGVPPLGSFSSHFAPATIDSGPSLRVNTTHRAEVVDFYFSSYRRFEGVPMEWTGSQDECRPGATSQQHMEATLHRINFYRAICGLPGNIRFDESLNDKCQQAALMMSKEGRLSHTPSSDWACFTADGKLAASKSNLHLGREGTFAIDGYMDDPGEQNYAVGHRRWILYPPQVTMGSGSVGAQGNYRPAQALWVTAPFGTRPSEPSWVAWPSPGYFPYALLPHSSRRWSFSMPNADFSKASVFVTQNGVALTNSIEHLAKGYGDNTLVWKLSPPSPFTVSLADTPISVLVSNVLLGNTYRSYVYKVILIDPERPVLSAVLLSSQSLRLSWRAPSPGYILQQSSHPQGELNWSKVESMPIIFGNSNIVDLPLNGKTAYFRMRRL